MNCSSVIMASVDTFSTIPLSISVCGSTRILSPLSFRIPLSVPVQDLKLKQSSIRFKSLKYQKVRSSPIRCAGQSGFIKAVLAVWNFGKSGIESGIKLVPDTVPRPIARISVTAVALAVALFVFKSFVSTVLFALAVMGLSYFAFLALNKDDASKASGGTSSVEDSLEEARRIMDKYK